MSEHPTERVDGVDGAGPPTPEGSPEDGATDATTEATSPAEASAGPTGPSVLDAPGGLHAALEAILMVTETPIAAAQLATVLAVPEAAVAGALADLVAEYTGGPRPRGFELREAAGGWRFYSAPAFAAAVDAFVLDGQTARLTQASLETLAVIAYRQPVARGRIAAIRGVNVDSVVRTLLTRGLIEEAGTDPESGAILYRTSSYFLERLGLRSLEDLPPLAPYLPDIDAFDDIDGATR
ncbi:SMC-Scp complex subunit ScpB [Occultella glacieicola]|uniref:SMC-Scp complex subunit ScpB n=1 Tax=Occultella glacieicola TaxID=2518684 RepID=A0ABY2DWP4_9MICO|nr:SMC-Scp complex subunit ScpB [Occultella glacieicola]TDE88124.1 SMC-Scp complex subunit ScpB [Occultella glacieicola]